PPWAPDPWRRRTPERHAHRRPWSAGTWPLRHRCRTACRNAHVSSWLSPRSCPRDSSRAGRTGVAPLPGAPGLEQLRKRTAASIEARGPGPRLAVHGGRLLIRRLTREIASNRFKAVEEGAWIFQDHRAAATAHARNLVGAPAVARIFLHEGHRLQRPG